MDWETLKDSEEYVSEGLLILNIRLGVTGYACVYHRIVLTEGTRYIAALAMIIHYYNITISVIK